MKHYEKRDDTQNNHTYPSVKLLRKDSKGPKYSVHSECQQKGVAFRLAYDIADYSSFYTNVECYRKLDPTVYTDVYNDIFLKKYATALIKKQWGANLIKFTGVAMLGGVQMNGETIYSQADEEIKLLEEQHQEIIHLILKKI